MGGWARGGGGRRGHIFRQVLGGGGGSDVFHWTVFSLKVLASGGGERPSPRPPPYSPRLNYDNF